MGSMKERWLETTMGASCLMGRRVGGWVDGGRQSLNER